MDRTNYANYGLVSRREILTRYIPVAGLAASGIASIADLLVPKTASASHDEHTGNPIKYHGFNRTEILKEMGQPVREILPQNVPSVTYDAKTKSTNLEGVIAELTAVHPGQPVFLFIYVDEASNGISALKYGEYHRSSSRALATVLKRLNEEYKGKIQLVAYDVGPELDKEGKAAISRLKAQLDLRSFPTTFIYFKGQSGNVEVDKATCDFLDIGKFNSEYGRFEDWILLNVIEPSKDGTVWHFNNTTNLQKKK